MSRRAASPAASVVRAPVAEKFVEQGAGISPATCSIAGALDALGDSWSILVLRELFYGVRRFNDMQRDLAISRSVLTARLARLVEIGVVATRDYQEPGERVRQEYRLTRKGIALLPVMVGLMEWGDEYVGVSRPMTLHERATGDQVRLELRTTAGTEVGIRDIEIRHGRKRRSTTRSA
ncbi:MAG: transcriptional regulator, HxlR family [Ilumatobacteraceae bacterium]|nr:transcriptional regulator, HxlR family [Ilumatobacteraceae bacterium]